MSRLLYSEGKSSFLGRKYWEAIIAIITIWGILFWIIIYLLFGYGDIWERIQQLLPLLIFGPIIVYLLIVTLIIPGLLATRFEIFDDKIVLPFSKRNGRLKLLGLPTGHTIVKEDVKRAQLDVLLEDGAYEVKIDGKVNTGRKGEWRCLFLLISGELFVLEWSDVHCKEECVPAIAEFIRGCEDDMSPFFVR